MLLLAFLFVVLIIALAFFINSLLDRRAQRRFGKAAEDRREPF